MEYRYNNNAFVLGTSKKLTIPLNLIVYGAVIYIGVLYYGLKLLPDFTIASEITFARPDFDNMVRMAVPAGIYLGGLTLLGLSIYEIYTCLNHYKVTYIKILSLFVTLQYIAAAMFLFGLTLVSR